MNTNSKLVSSCTVQSDIGPGQAWRKIPDNHGNALLTLDGLTVIFHLLNSVPWKS
jgi:hypothetical protein